MRPSDEQVEAWCKTPDMDWSELKAELLRARAAEVEKEAKLREAEERLGFLQGVYDESAVEIRRLEERIRTMLGAQEAGERRAEKAERDLDEARERLRETSKLLHARSGSASGHCGAWEACAACAQDRAALGQKP